MELNTTPGDGPARYVHLGMFMLGGMTLFLVFSYISKRLAGADPFEIKGIIVPLVVGCATGLLVGLGYVRIEHLNSQLRLRVNQLEQLLPICASCKKIRNSDGDPADQASWEDVEVYIEDRIGSQFSHGLCPDCQETLYGEQ